MTYIGYSGEHDSRIELCTVIMEIVTLTRVTLVPPTGPVYSTAQPFCSVQEYSQSSLSSSLLTSEKRCYQFNLSQKWAEVSLFIDKKTVGSVGIQYDVGVILNLLESDGHCPDHWMEEFFLISKLLEQQEHYHRVINESH